jgi:hypothetical protein
MDEPAEPQFIPCNGCGRQPVVLPGGVINHQCATSCFRGKATGWDRFQEEVAKAREVDADKGRRLDGDKPIPCPCGETLVFPIHDTSVESLQCASCDRRFVRRGKDGRVWLEPGQAGVTTSHPPAGASAAEFADAVRRTAEVSRQSPGIGGPGGDQLAEVPCPNCGDPIRVPINSERGDRCYCRGCCTAVESSGERVWLEVPFNDPDNP